MATKQATAQQQQAYPGMFFRVPGIGARTRFIPETGPCAPKTTFALNKGSITKLKFGKFTTLDIIRGYFMVTKFTSKFTKNAATEKQSPLFPANWLQQIQVQFESAYSTYRLPGFLAQVFQSFRSMFQPNDRESSALSSGAAAFPGKALGSTWFAAYTKMQLPTPTLAVTVTGVAQSYYMFWEVPVSMTFDLYYTLATNGVPKGPPIPRCIVSPQRMAATTRNVVPNVTANPALLTKTRLTAPVATSAGAGKATTLKVTVSWWRTAWIPTDKMTTEPVGRPWQYTRDYITWQPGGAKNFPVPLDTQVPGQGQILAVVFATWTPTLTATYGAMVPFTKYTNVQLLLGSSIQLENTAPNTNAYRWLLQHGSVLPAGFMGWDYALQPTGKLTNEYAINTLVQNGAQLRIAFKSTFSPNSKATVYVGLEVLKKVGQ